MEHRAAQFPAEIRKSEENANKARQPNPAAPLLPQWQPF
jgi:hypothetical protein